MLLERRVLPEEGTRQGGRDDQHVKQRTADHGSGQQAQRRQPPQDKTGHSRQAAQGSKRHEHSRAQHQRITQPVGPAEGRGLFQPRGLPFPDMVTQVVGMAVETKGFHGKPDQRQHCQHLEQLGKVTALHRQ